MRKRFGAGPLRVKVVAEGLGFVEGPAVLPDGKPAQVSMSRGSVVILDADDVCLGPGAELFVTAAAPAPCCA
ncbi:hypothetical protein [Nocardia sp. NPDC051750]|uniref:hypothetical protein n=1 Tax=Nocardia sp. NPDC051750 TaxID=3364325 RepID=UPI0037B0DCC3